MHYTHYALYDKVINRDPMTGEELKSIKEKKLKWNVLYYKKWFTEARGWVKSEGV